MALAPRPSLAHCLSQGLRIGGEDGRGRREAVGPGSLLPTGRKHHQRAGVGLPGHVSCRRGSHGQSHGKPSSTQRRQRTSRTLGSTSQRTARPLPRRRQRATPWGVFFLPAPASSIGPEAKRGGSRKAPSPLATADPAGPSHMGVRPQALLLRPEAPTRTPLPGSVAPARCGGWVAAHRHVPRPAALPPPSAAAAAAVLPATGPICAGDGLPV